jgi:4-hydroxy 2-oxovalerate aldolase
MLPIDQVAELLGMIAEDKKISFDMEYAESLWRNYNEDKQICDDAVVSEMKSVFQTKTVFLIGPGKSIIANRKEIEAILSDDNVVSIGLNLTGNIDVDYILATRNDVLEMAINKKKNVLTTSNVSKGVRGNVKILNYKNWIEVTDRTHDSSFVIAMNLLKSCGVKNVYLAGLDGFVVNINENYSDPNLRRPVSIEQVGRRNSYYKDFISRMREYGIDITFVTPSKYE